MTSTTITLDPTCTATASGPACTTITSGSACTAITKRSFLQNLILPPSDNSIYMCGFLFGVLCNISENRKKKSLNILDSPLSSLWNASLYGCITACGAGFVSCAMPKQLTPIIPFVLIISGGYLGYNLIKSYISNSKDDQ